MAQGVLLAAVPVHRDEIMHATQINETARRVSASMESVAKTKKRKERGMSESQTRIVQIFIADPDPKIKEVEKRLLYQGDQKLTDLTDEELFFEIPIKELLDKHNEYRKVTIDRKASERSQRDICLEPIRIRDLRMIVAEIAVF